MDCSASSSRSVRRVQLGASIDAREDHRQAIDPRVVEYISEASGQTVLFDLRSEWRFERTVGLSETDLA